jgi:hypothetical protein
MTTVTIEQLLGIISRGIPGSVEATGLCVEFKEGGDEWALAFEGEDSEITNREGLPF